MGGLETSYEPILFGSAVAFMYVSLPFLSPQFLSETMNGQFERDSRDTMLHLL